MSFLNSKGFVIKSLFVLSLVVVGFTPQAHALVADMFECTTEVRQIATGVVAKQKSQFFVPRLPDLKGSTNGVQVTSGKLEQPISLESNGARIHARLYYYYRHAAQTDIAGRVIAARQFGCLGSGASYNTDLSKPDDAGQVLIVCQDDRFTPFDPDPANRWRDVPFVNGFPEYSAADLAGMPSVMTLAHNGIDVATVTSSCSYLGTSL